MLRCTTVLLRSYACRGNFSGRWKLPARLLPVLLRFNRSCTSRFRRNLIYANSACFFHPSPISSITEETWTSFSPYLLCCPCHVNRLNQLLAFSRLSLSFFGNRCHVVFLQPSETIATRASFSYTSKQRSRGTICHVQPYLL